MSKKSRCWCFTLNNPQEFSAETRNEIKRRLSAVKYWVIGKEKGENGTPHWQGFVWTHNQVRFTRIQELLCHSTTGAHIELCKGTAEENVLYCKKGEQTKAEWKQFKADGPNYGKNVDYEEYGEPPCTRKRKGELGAEATRAKYRKLYDYAAEGRHEELADEFPREALVCSSHIQRVRESKIGNKTKNLKGPCGLWLTGLANAGKSRKARKMFPGAYMKKANKWWCKYNDQDVVIIDDVSPFQKKDITDELKHWADMYPFPAETKGGGYQGLRPRKIVVTSQYTIDEVWQDKETREAMHRRFKEVTMVEDPSRPPCVRVDDLSDDELQGWEVEEIESESEEEHCTQLDKDWMEEEL